MDWSQYRTAYGTAEHVPDYLAAVLSNRWDDANEAAHQLWINLCHQHAYVSSAALPALPFLLEGLEIDDDRLRTELLDILLGFAVCIGDGPQDGEWSLGEERDWVVQLRRELVAQHQLFRGLITHSHPEIADLATQIVSALPPDPIERACGSR